MTDPTPTPHTRPSLLVRLRDADDAEAWGLFVDTYAPLIYRWGRRRGLQDADAADVTQEVLGRVGRALRSFEYRPERGRFRDWLGTVTRHRVADFQQRQARRATAGGADDLAALPAPQQDGEWTEEFNAHVLRAALERARPHFTPATWTAFEQTWLEDRPAVEVADALGLRLEAVYTAKSRVLRRLQEEVLLLAEDLPRLLPPG